MDIPHSGWRTGCLGQSLFPLGPSLRQATQDLITPHSPDALAAFRYQLRFHLLTA